MTTQVKIAFGIVIGLLLVIVFSSSAPRNVFSGVNVGNDYNATTTPWTGQNADKSYVLKGGNGTLGSVIVLGASADGELKFYDATTTNITQRANKATSTIASLPDNAAVGTYTFDVEFKDGLIVESVEATASTTITWR